MTVQILGKPSELASSSKLQDFCQRKPRGIWKYCALCTFSVHQRLQSARFEPAKPARLADCIGQVSLLLLLTCRYCGLRTPTPPTPRDIWNLQRLLSQAGGAELCRCAWGHPGLSATVDIETHINNAAGSALLPLQRQFDPC